MNIKEKIHTETAIHILVEKKTKLNFKYKTKYHQFNLCICVELHLAKASNFFKLSVTR